MKQKQDYTFNFSLLFFIHFIAYAFITSQRMTFLIDMGYSLDQRSLIFSLMPVFTIVSQLFIGYLSDRFKTIKKIMIWIVALSAVTSFLFYRLEVQLFIFHCAIAILSQSFIVSMTDLNDVWVLESKGPSKEKYGFIRAFGSLGWSIGSFLLAKIILSYGYHGLAYATLILNVILLFVLITISDDKAQVHIDETVDPVSFKDVFLLIKDKYYLNSIAIVFFVNMAINMSSYLLIDKILSLGGNVMTIGYRGVIAAGVEVPLMLIGDRIHKKMGSFKMIVIGVSFYLLQFLGYYLATTNKTILMVTVLQAIGLPFFQVAIKYLLLEMSPEHLKTSGQMTGPAVMNGITGIIYPIITAITVNHFSINAPFLLSFIFGVIGISLTFFLFQQLKLKSN